MKYLFNTLPLYFFLTLTSCREDAPEPAPEPANIFTQLKVGNYWVYEQFQINEENGEEKELSKTDSIYISGDTTMGLDTYFIMKGSWFGYPFMRIVRNEEEKLIDLNGEVLFSTEDKSEIINIQRSVNNVFIDSIYTILDNKTEEIQTSTSTFTPTRQYEKVFYLTQNLQHNFRVRQETEYYSKEVGVVQYTTFYTGAPINVQMRLVRYKLS